MSWGRTKIDVTDTLFSKYIRLLEGGFCRMLHDGRQKYFGLSQGLQCHHFITRGRKGTRYERDNAIALCTYHHNIIQASKEKNVELALEIIGRNRYEELVRQSEKPPHYTDSQIKAIRSELRSKISILQG